MQGENKDLLKRLKIQKIYQKKNKKNFTKNYLCIWLAASGRISYVICGLKYAKSIGAKTVSISCNKNSKISKISDIIPIEAIGGPEF